MILSLIAVAAFAQTAKPTLVPSVEEVRKGMYADARKLKGFYEEAEFTFRTEETRTAVFKRWIDGSKWRMDLTGEGEEIFTMASDGRETWSIFFQNDSYSVSPRKADPLTEPYKKDEKELEEGSFNVSLFNGYDWIFKSSPEPQAVSLENVEVKGRKLRKYVVQSKISDTRKVTMALFFHPDRWLLTEIQIDGNDREGRKVGATVVMKTQKFNEKPSDSLFRLDQSKVAGMKKIEVPDGNPYDKLDP